ncbi:MAG: glycerol kinase GlpK [Beutenbergiaceae bacterium]
MTRRLIVGLDQGTTSTRAVVFDATGTEQGSSQMEHRQHYPQPGWVEHDATEILTNARRTVEAAVRSAGAVADEVVALGITNQTETTVIWDRRTGAPIGNAVTWQDTRGADVLASLDRADPRVAQIEQDCMTGINDYFAATKIMWLLDNVPGARARAEAGELAYGSMESWLAWNLTGGPDGGVHVTDVSNASRTLMMDLRSLDWSTAALDYFSIPRPLLPTIVPTSQVVGHVADGEPIPGVPIAALMGDQQAATFGHTAFTAGEAKCTYGTGNFLIYNTGTVARTSSNGLIPTVIYQLAGQAPVYGLEGSVAVTGSLVQWLRDSMGFITRAEEIESLAASVPDSGGVTIVPAFSGLYAPHWHRQARGTITGLTHFSTPAHLARAALDACALQTAELISAAQADTGVPLATLRVDGGGTNNDLLMSIQAGLIGVPVSKPQVTEATALGVAYGAGLAIGLWSGLDQLRGHWRELRRWQPTWTRAERTEAFARWARALQATFAAEEPAPGQRPADPEPAIG